jgi:hypothetical protein
MEFWAGIRVATGWPPVPPSGVGQWSVAQPLRECRDEGMEQFPRLGRGAQCVAVHVGHLGDLHSWVVEKER